MNQSIDTLLQNRSWNAVFPEIRKSLDTDSRGLWVRCFQNDSLLLRWARSRITELTFDDPDLLAFQDPKSYPYLFATDGAPAWDLDVSAPDASVPPGWARYEAQLKLLWAATESFEESEDVEDSEDENSIQVAITEAIQLWTAEWRYRKTSFVIQAERQSEREPAVVQRLPNDGWRTVFRELAQHFGWLHPGLLAVAEVIAYLWGTDEEPPHDGRVSTWILFADESDRDEPRGQLGRLTVERIAGGCGAWSPHPLRGTSVLTTERFQDAIQNAWWAAVGSRLPDVSFDYRWWIELIDEDGDYLNIPLDGPSGEVALTCALWALGENAVEPLDPHVAISASLAEPGGESRRIATVGAIPHKSTSGELKLRHIEEIVVADGQSVAGTEIRKTDQRLDIVAVKDWLAAYERLARFPRWTLHAKQYLFEQARDELATKCDPYILSSLSERVMTGDSISRLTRQALTEEEVRAVVLGQLPTDANRVRILGDSGLGKTMFLRYCEQEIAAHTAVRLPLRIDGLSEFDWRAEPETVVKSLLAKRLSAALPSSIEAPDRLNWLNWLIRQRRVVFLLDALDQTRDQLDGLKTFLGSHGISDCPVLLTGRPETLATRGTVFEETHWRTLDIDLFDEPRQREFLGEDLAALLVLTDDERLTIPELIEEYNLATVAGEYVDREAVHDLIRRRRTDLAWQAEIDRKRQGADLLQVPLLLKLVRDFGQNPKLTNLRNRAELYREAIQHLIKKGMKSLDSTSQKSAIRSNAAAWEWLGKLGWATLLADSQKSGGFRGILDGRAFRNFCQENRDLPVDALHQLDLTTASWVLEQPNVDCLAWRHLSFAEYFGALQLIHLDAAERTNLIRMHANTPHWQWVWRFALSCAFQGTQVDSTLVEATEFLFPEDSTYYEHVLHTIGADLIRFGNPFLVYDAHDRDGVELPGLIDRLARWLVHRDWEQDRNWTNAWNPDWARPVLDEWMFDILETYFQREYRNSRCLDPAWELLEASEHPRAIAIRKRFLGEFAAILADSNHPGNTIARSLVDETNFVRCPLDPTMDGQPFWMGSPDGVGDDDERPRQQVVVSPFQLQRGTVTNRQFELFDPTHRGLRDAYSHDDDQPVTLVSWYMARMFCRWMSGESLDTGQEGRYRLPTEAEWEFACRAGQDGEMDLFHGGDALGSHQANFDGRFPYPRDAETGPFRNMTTSTGTIPANAWGIFDMHGNVAEWCQDCFERDTYRRWQAQAVEKGNPICNPQGPTVGSSHVLRGGSFVNVSVNCRSGYRLQLSTHVRSDDIGFRLLCIES